MGMSESDRKLFDQTVVERDAAVAQLSRQRIWVGAYRLALALAIVGASLAGSVAAYALRHCTEVTERHTVVSQRLKTQRNRAVKLLRDSRELLGRRTVAFNQAQSDVERLEQRLARSRNELSLRVDVDCPHQGWNGDRCSQRTAKMVARRVERILARREERMAMRAFGGCPYLAE